jgi:hypothetical protein
MSTEPADRQQVDRQQQKIADFLRLLPLTVEIAGLSHCETGKYLNEDQMTIRANNLRAAYKIARQLIVDLVK